MNISVYGEWLTDVVSIAGFRGNAGVEGFSSFFGDVHYHFCVESHIGRRWLLVVGFSVSEVSIFSLRFYTKWGKRGETVRVGWWSAGSVNVLTNEEIAGRRTRPDWSKLLGKVEGSFYQVRRRWKVRKSDGEEKRKSRSYVSNGQRTKKLFLSYDA